jgi:hypothetical protein
MEARMVDDKVTVNTLDVSKWRIREVELFIDHSRNLGQLFYAAGYRHKFPLAPASFDLAGTGKYKIIASVVRPQQELRKESVEAGLKALNLMSAGMIHLMALGTKYPHMQFDFPIAALKAELRVGNPRIAILVGSEAKGRKYRQVALVKPTVVFKPDMAFLALPFLPHVA